MTDQIPNLETFDPKVIPYQYEVIKAIRTADYSQGVHEMLLSGSVGCLREDALVETAFGQAAIADITQSDFLVSHHDSSNQLSLCRGSGAFPKDKGILYRVVSEHGEFVASGNHLVATYPGTYEQIDSLFSRSSSFVAPHVHYQRNHTHDLSMFGEGVLRCWDKVSNLINHCVKHIHQCGQQLPLGLETALCAIPLKADALEYGLFFYSHTREREDGFQGLELKHDHTSGSPFHLSMQSFSILLERTLLGEEGFYSRDDLELYSHKLSCILTQLLFQTHNAHQQDLLFLLSFLSNNLHRAFEPPSVSITNTTYTIEKLPGQDWYWDMQVPNTNNYIAGGAIHHNSAKSILMAHVGVTHNMLNERAKICLARRSMPDLKETILTEILEHIETVMVEGEDYQFNKSTGNIDFSNGSGFICRSWADKNYRKARSLKLSGLLIEEVTENTSAEFEGFYKEYRARVGRRPWIKENFVLAATNPDTPAHAAYEYFIVEGNQYQIRKVDGKVVKNIIPGRIPTRHTFYSVTTDNPFLPAWYIEQLKQTFTERECRRMIYGEWLDIRSEVIYYAFDEQKSVIDNYTIDTNYPIGITWDFNIGVGKPMSCALFQYINGRFYFFEEVVLESTRTLDILEELSARGSLSFNTEYHIFGDASGKNRDTRSIRSDYDIIKQYLDKLNKKYVYRVPLANPPIRTRHIMMNGQLKNAYGHSSIKVTRGCPTLIKGLRLAKLKQGGNYIEDDSDAFQHITTAVGYAVVRTKKNEMAAKSKSVQL